MPEPDRLSPSDEADLAALADGRLDPQRAEAVRARVADDPRLAAALERQRAAVAAISAAAGEVAAPPALRARIEDLQREAATPSGRGRSRIAARQREAATPSGRGRSRWRSRIAARQREPATPGGRARAGRGSAARGRGAGGRRALAPASGLVLAACAALALMLVLGRGGATVDSVLTVASRPPVAGTAIGAPAGPLLDEQFVGVRFPNYAARFGWQPDGVRRDDVGGRATRTVFYRRDGRRIAYTVVSGDALRKPDGGRAERREGVALIALRRGGRTVVVWSRQAHTCVLSGEGVSAAALLELASWKGKGQVRF